MFLSLEVRSYERDTPHHHHEHAQLVLPIRGRMDIDVNGRGGCIDQALAALVEPGSEHSQHCDIDSRFLVLDCAPSTLETLHIERLARNIYVPIPPATRRLIEFAELIGHAQLSIATCQLGPLLLSSLSPDAGCFTDPMERLIGRLRSNPGAHWNNEAMSRFANMSPQAWLTELRVQEAQRWLRGTALSIAEIALRAGFSDQASLTRTMQRLKATTPAAYRRAQQQPG